MGSKQIGIGLYEFLIESELQHYYNGIKNDLKVFVYNLWLVVIELGGLIVSLQFLRFKV